MELENCELDSEQIAAFIARHRASLVEFRFEEVTLRNGDWASTLEPLRVLKRLERSRHRRRQQQETAAAATVVTGMRDLCAASDSTLCNADEMDVPVMLMKEVGKDFDEEEEEPIIMETLEPQEASVPCIMGGLGRNLGMRKWFGGRKTKGNVGVVRHERKVSDHLKRVLHGGIFTWR
jgi:hypothetical protein